ncbi:hypothetical protein ACFO1B_23295 [Dactylosporangium siamense]|uniref:Uncharacterized protein n=1 Tax=Dactylosporangium siamense TaxID=685454 RepID=A0A919PN10_9ACTN|nr:hypothetical protein [Dactylosporangium siamense]GIG47122.1 hypothetical protein Dsi01nite_051630 [Dactylosporangium siamense]
MDSSTPDPAAVLAEMGELRARSRRLAHAGAWLPALILAALPLLSIGLYRHPFATVNASSVGYPFWGGLPEEQRAALASYVFWLIVAPLAFVLVAQWYRRREHRQGIRVPWRVPVTAGLAALLCLLALFAAPTGEPDPTLSADSGPWWRGLLTPLLSIAVAVIALGVVERSTAITLSGVWMAVLAWQFCAIGFIGGLFGWQTWILNGGEGSGPGGQLTLFGLDRPGPTLILMTLPLLLVGLVRAARSRGQLR